MKKWNILLAAISYFLLLSFNTYSFDEKGIEFIHDEGEGLLNEVSDITSLKVLSNLSIPKGVFAGIIHKGGNAPNLRFLTDLYDIIYKINKQEKLELATFGKQQNIDLIVVGSNDEVSELKQKIKKSIKKNDALIYLKAIRTDLIFGINHNLSDRWFQDWGEFLGHGYKDGQLINGIFYVNRNRGLKKIVQEIAKMLELPFIYSKSHAEISGDYGGNLEATPDGIIFNGNTMSSAQTEQIRDFGNKDKLVTLDSSWLAVGHVDEMFSIIPSVHKCKYPTTYKGPKANYALVAADPFYGLQLIKNAKEGFLSLSYISPVSGINPLKFYYISSIKSALRHFLIDYDKEVNKNNINKYGFEACSRYEKSQSYCDLIQFNIDAKERIEKNIIKLTKKTPCQNVPIVKVPQIYREVYWGKGVSFFPGTANMLVLRDYLIVPKINFEPFSNTVFNILNKEVGGSINSPKVFFIDELKEYHDLMGEIHCGTNVFREINLLIN